MYHTTAVINSGPLSGFIAKYQHREKFLDFCKECKNYHTRWSCPPLSMDVSQFLQHFGHMYVIGVKVIYDADTIRRTNTAEKMKEVTVQSLREVKRKLAEALLAVERSVPGSVSLASGGCNICPRCARYDGLPCRYPERMRHSLESLGFDLTAITADFLQIELKWSKESLPEYYTLIHALLTKHPVSGAVEEIRRNIDFIPNGKMKVF